MTIELPTIFTITIFSLVGPLINLSPAIPVGITAFILCLAAIDTLGWQNRGIGGVVFNLETINQNQQDNYKFATLLDKFCTVWIAGIAAEIIVYGEAWGGEEDRQKISTALSEAGIPKQMQQQKMNLAFDRAKHLLKQNQESYQSLVEAMTEHLSVEACYQVIK